MRRFAPVLALLLVAAFAASAAAFEVGARGTYWFPKLSGSAQSDLPGSTEFDVKDDLGVGDENVPGGEAFLGLGKWHLRLGYAKLSFDGSRNLARTIVFNGTTFNASTNVASRLDVKMYDGEIQYDILSPDVVAAAFNLGLILQVKYLDGSVELAAADNTTSKDFRVPIPMVGVAAGVGILKNFIRVDARAAGLGYSGNHILDADGYVSVIPFPFVRLQGGYRYMDIKVDESDVRASLKLKGPYAGLQVSF